MTEKMHLNGRNFVEAEINPSEKHRLSTQNTRKRFKTIHIFHDFVKYAPRYFNLDGSLLFEFPNKISL